MVLRGIYSIKIIGSIISLLLSTLLFSLILNNILILKAIKIDFVALSNIKSYQKWFSKEKMSVFELKQDESNI